MHLKHARLRLQPTAASSSVVEPASTVIPSDASESTPPHLGPKRLKVTDGGDQGRSFALPDVGTVSVGKVGGPAEIGLHDLYVAKIHCTLTIEAVRSA